MGIVRVNYPKKRLETGCPFFSFVFRGGGGLGGGSLELSTPKGPDPDDGCV